MSNRFFTRSTRAVDLSGQSASHRVYKTSMKQYFRLLQILYTGFKYQLDEIVLSSPKLSAFRIFSRFNPFFWFRCFNKKSNSNLTPGERLCLALEQLGPLFVKFGQVLSTRRDFLPDEIAFALAKLQDHVKPFDSNVAIELIEQSLNSKISEIFAEFNPIPIASASIAQVHEAVLLSGQTVVVKVLRPDIRKIIERDIALLYQLAQFAEKNLKISRRLRAIDIVREIEKTILDELDLLREGANAVQLKRNNARCPWVKIPQIYWPYATTDVLVMEKIHGIPISDKAQLEQKKVNLKILASRLIELFYHQAFNDCFFHADMHPGNLLIQADEPENPIIQLVDFGIVGTLDPNDQYYLTANFLAFFKQDYRRVAKLHIDSGWVPQKTRVDEFESAMRTVCEPIFDRPLKEISLGHTLLRLLQIAQRFHMIIQPQLLLLQKTLWNIEGISRTLYPDLDIWNFSKPILENWMKKQVGMKGLLKRIKNNWPEISQSLPIIPELIVSVLKTEQQRQQLLRQEQEHLFETRYELTEPHQKPARSVFWLGAGLGLLLSGLGLYLFQTPNHTDLNSTPNFTYHLLHLSHLTPLSNLSPGTWLAAGGLVVCLLALIKK